MRIVDLSVALKANIASDPPSMLPTIEYIDHKQGAQDFAMMFPGLKPEHLPDGEARRSSASPSPPTTARIWTRPGISTRTMGGKPAMKIDEIPLEWCFSAGREARLPRQARRLCVHAPPTSKRELDRIGYQLKPLDIVLVNTAAGTAYGEPDFVDNRLRHGPRGDALSARAGVRVTGTDGWSWDAPFSTPRKRYDDDQRRRA